MMSYYSAPGQQQQQQHIIQQQQQPMMYAPAPSVYAPHLQQPVIYQQVQNIDVQPRPVSPVGMQQIPQPRPVSPVAMQQIPQPRPVSPVAMQQTVVQPRPVSPVADTGLPSSLASSQLGAIATLRQRISAEAALYSPDVMAYCTDACLARYLRAREWDIEAAYKMLKASLDWRATYKPHLITEAQIQGPLKIATMFYSGYDKQNRPIIYVKPGGAQSQNTIDERVMYVAWLMEHVTGMMADGVEQVMIIMDFSEFGKRAKSPDSRQTAQIIVNMLQNHYPERLGSGIVINSPWYFNLLFKMISPFINANTKKKMAWITGNNQEIFNILCQSVDPSQLLTLYGGKNGNFPAGEGAAHN